MVELVRAGHSPEELAREFEPTAQSVRTWVEQTGADEGHSDEVASAERAELAALRRGVRQLREEREILRKAAVFFARQTDRSK